MTAWPRWATSSERFMLPLRRSAALAVCALSVSLALSVHGCGSGALHRATEERHEYPAGVVQMRWRTVIHPYAASDAQPEECATGALVDARAETGELRWARSLAAASDQFVDVDSTPVLRDDLVIAASYSGGLYALRAKDGDQVWRMGVEGAVAIRAGANRLYVASPRDGLAAVTMQGQIEWRQGLAQAGDLTPPQEVGPYLVFTGSRSGLFVLDRLKGEVLQIFDPGRGMCAAPLIDAERREIYVLANSGTLYALSLVW